MGKRIFFLFQLTRAEGSRGAKMIGSSPSSVVGVGVDVGSVEIFKRLF